MQVKRGDRVFLKTHGMRVPAVAASDSKDGSLQIKYKGTFSTVDLSDVELVDADAMHVTGVQADVDQGTPPCPVCGKSGELVPPKTADAERRILIASFECESGHRWQLDFPLN